GIRAPLVTGFRRVLFRSLPPAVWRAIAIDGERSFTWVSSGPGIRVTAHHSIEPTVDGSKVTLSVKYSGLLAPLLARLTTKVNNKDRKSVVKGRRVNKWGR